MFQVLYLTCNSWLRSGHCLKEETVVGDAILFDVNSARGCFPTVPACRCRSTVFCRACFGCVHALCHKQTLSRSIETPVSLLIVETLLDAQPTRSSPTMMIRS